jgi:hypothetical protein
MMVGKVVRVMAGGEIDGCLVGLYHDGIDRWMV